MNQKTNNSNNTDEQINNNSTNDQNSNIVETIDTNSSKQKNNNILKKVCIILSIVIAFFGFGKGIIVIILSLTAKQVDFFGPVLNIIGFLAGIVFIIYVALIIAVIWIIYGIIMLIKNKNKKSIIKTITISIVLLLAITFAINNYNYKNKDLNKVLNEPPNYEYYNDTSYYFIYKDKIYYYKLEHNNSFTKLYDKLYVMDLKGKNNKLLAETDELRYATFYFVHNDYAYYYTMYYNTNKKIDLKTGKITTLGTNDFYLAKTLNDGMIYSFIDNPVAGNSYSIFKKYDIVNNKTISEIKTNYSMAGNEYYFDYDGVNIYYLEKYYSNYPTIYKNNEIIYEFKEHTRYTLPDIKFIAVNNNYLYFKQNNNIYKLNIISKSIEKEIKNTLGDLARIGSGNNTDNYYYSNKNIYSFDMELDNFQLIIYDIEKKPDYVYNINNNLIFTENTDNIQYNGDIDNSGSVVIYNKENDHIDKFYDVRKASFDEKQMYLLFQSNKVSYIKTINLYE